MFSLLSDAPSTPQINCSLSGDYLTLTCEADFQKPLDYVWKITGRKTSTGPEVLIPKENVDTGGKATCFVTYLEIIKSSEIPLNQCFATYQGNGLGCICNSKRLNWKIA